MNTRESLRQPVPGWDIEVTRMVAALVPRFSRHFDELGRLLTVTGMTLRPEYGLSLAGYEANLNLVGRHGLLCRLQLSVVDGMAIGTERGVGLDILLLDAKNRLVAFCTPPRPRDRNGFCTDLADLLGRNALALRTEYLYACIVENYDLLRQQRRVRTE